MTEHELGAAIAVARDAGALLRQRLNQPRDVAFKGVVDLVTDADRASEQLIADRLRHSFPQHRIVAEEGARGTVAAEAAPSSFTWLIDPLDGTTNYAHRYPHFAVSIALAREGTVQLGVVYDPMRDELFVARRGHGATLNGAPLHVSATAELIHALLATGFPYDLTQRAEAVAIWDAFVNRVQGTRRDGSAALDLCYVAAGRLDGFWERPLNAWDMAAGALLVEEVGGRVSAYGGRPFDLDGHEIIASNGRLHAAMESVITGVVGDGA